MIRQGYQALRDKVLENRVYQSASQRVLETRDIVRDSHRDGVGAFQSLKSAPRFVPFSVVGTLGLGCYIGRGLDLLLDLPQQTQDLPEFCNYLVGGSLGVGIGVFGMYLMIKAASTIEKSLV